MVACHEECIAISKKVVIEIEYGSHLRMITEDDLKQVMDIGTDRGLVDDRSASSAVGR